MEIPTNMHLLIFLAACVLFTTTECATSYQDCPGYVETGTVGVLTCVGYSTPEITWEFKSGQSSFSTIGKCTSSSTCTLESTYTNAGLFVLTAITGTSSQLNLTAKYTAGPKTVRFACDGVNCDVNIAEPTTTEMPTTTPEATTETTEETTGTGEPSSSTPETTQEEDELSGGEIAGIVIGCFIVVAVIAGVGFIVWCKIEQKFFFKPSGNGTETTTPPNGTVPDKPPNPNVTIPTVPADGQP